MDGLSEEEIEANGLENLLLADTKEHADWHLLSPIAESASGAMQGA